MTKYLMTVGAVLALVTALSPAQLIEEGRGFDLSGVVSGVDGGPIAEARVLIRTAKPRQGTSPYCPSCYRDCAKWAATGPDGAFLIEDLDRGLLFKILVVASGYGSEFVGDVDPEAGSFDVSLEPREPVDDPARLVRGRVLGPDGKPIPDALIEPQMVDSLDPSRSRIDITPLGVTDGEGHFTLALSESNAIVTYKVSARGLAPAIHQAIAGEPESEIVLNEGAIITGRLVDATGAGVSDVLVGAVQTEQYRRGRGREIERDGMQVMYSMLEFYGEMTVGTDADGRFTFVSVPYGFDFAVYGKMASLGDRGAVVGRTVRPSISEVARDIGDLPITPGYRLSGQVVLTDGASIPPATRILIGRVPEWDSKMTDLDADGHFEFTCLPRDRYELSVRVPGYWMTERNASLDRLNPFLLVGRIDGDRSGLVVELAKGAMVQSQRDFRDDDDHPRRHPLRGVETADQ